MKIRKNHARKRYRYSTNRKTLRKSRESTGRIQDPLLENLWIERKRPVQNFHEMGLSSDPNKAITIPNYKQKRYEKVKEVVNCCVEEDISEEDLKQKVTFRTRGYVVEQLEAIVNAPRDSLFRLPKNSVSHLSYFLEKYKLNYKDMVTDRRNYLQWTWKQFRMKIKQFMSVTEQFDEYLKKHNLKQEEITEWKEYESDNEWE